MIDLSSTAHEFSLLNGLAGTVGTLPSLFIELNSLAAAVNRPGFTSTHDAFINTLDEASTVWLKVASALKLATGAQADVCIRLKASEDKWLTNFALVAPGNGPLNPQQLDLHYELMSHGLLLQGFTSVFGDHIQALDRWAAEAVPALSPLSDYIQRWYDAMETCAPAALARLPWTDLLMDLQRTAVDLDPTACEWLAYKDVPQALMAIRRAGHMLLIAPVTAAQHATLDLGRLAKVLTDSANQLKYMQPEQPRSVYKRHLTFAVQSCDSAQLQCEHLLKLMDKKGAR